MVTPTPVRPPSSRPPRSLPWAPRPSGRADARRCRAARPGQGSAYLRRIHLTPDRRRFRALCGSHESTLLVASTPPTLGSACPRRVQKTNSHREDGMRLKPRGRPDSAGTSRLPLDGEARGVTPRPTRRSAADSVGDWPAPCVRHRADSVNFGRPVSPSGPSEHHPSYSRRTPGRATFSTSSIVAA